jgi:hypothetical protein
MWRHVHYATLTETLETITQKRDVANMRSAASSWDNLAKHQPLLPETIALGAAETPRFGVLASTMRRCERGGEPLGRRSCGDPVQVVSVASRPIPPGPVSGN